MSGRDAVRGTGAVGAALGLIARGAPAHGPRPGASGYEAAAPLLEAALIGASRDPALLPALADALGQVSRVAQR